MLFSQILNVSLVSSVNITFSAGFLLILCIYFFNSWSNLFNRFFVENTKQFYSAWFQPLLKLVLIFVKNFASPSLCCRLFFGIFVDFSYGFVFFRRFSWFPSAFFHLFSLFHYFLSFFRPMHRCFFSIMVVGFFFSFFFGLILGYYFFC